MLGGIFEKNKIKDKLITFNEKITQKKMKTNNYLRNSLARLTSWLRIIGQKLWTS